MKEIWRDIKGYEGIYQVSNLGRVKSSDRVDYAERSLKGRMLKQNPNSGGYLMVNLFLNGKQKTRTLHQLVAEAFLNHEACGMKVVIDHIDNDKQNNKLENLQLISQRQNSSKNSIGKTSIYTGVSFRPKINKYVARCRHNKKQIYLGGFETELEASEAYNDFLKTIELK
jgi:hypothetical protein